MTQDGSSPGRTALLSGLLLPRWSADLPAADVLQQVRTRRDTDAGETVAALLVPADRVAELLAAVEPGDDVAVTLVPSAAGGGLSELVLARGLLADQPWLRLVGAWLDLVGDPLVTAAELTLDALEFPVPTAFFLPPDGDEASRDAVLDLLAADGAEHAGWHAEHAATDATAAFLVGCVRRRVRYELSADATDVAAMLSAAAEAIDGADVDTVRRALAATAARPEAAGGQAARTRQLLRGVGTDDLGRTLRLLGPPVTDDD
jgi:hypothetical protein